MLGVSNKANPKPNLPGSPIYAMEAAAVPGPPVGTISSPWVRVLHRAHTSGPVAPAMTPRVIST